MKTNALNFEIAVDQFIEIGVASDHVSPCNTRRAALNLHRAAKFIEHVGRKKCDLTFVIALKIEVAIAANSPRGYAFDRRHLGHGKRVRFTTVVADKIVPGRNVQVTDFHPRQQYPKTLQMEDAESISPGKIIRRKDDGSLEYLRDELTIEEPLEIRIGSKTLATTMRTPGHDDELAAGFLVSEAIIRERRQIVKISADHDNVVTVDVLAGTKMQL